MMADVDFTKEMENVDLRDHNLSKPQIMQQYNKACKKIFYILQMLSSLSYWHSIKETII